MAYYLPSSGSTRDGESRVELATPPDQICDMADLKIFWGPDICRLEYLLHLVDTGRIKDERQPRF